MTSLALGCPYHPDRPGVGVCISCRRICCADCATKLDGVNHCRECLAKKIGTATRAPGLARRSLERVFALAVIAGSFSLLSLALTGVGFAANGTGWFGTARSETARALENATDGLRSFQRDVGRFPSEREGLAALFLDQPVPGDPPIAGWKGPYMTPSAGSSESKDGYGSHLRYIGPQGRARPAVLSLGANRTLDTDTRALLRGDAAGGDDMIRWVE